MKTDFFTYDLSKVSYLRGGSGDQLLIAFHGFADSSDTFEEVMKVLGEKYTVYVINLPWHGKTVWAKNDFDLADVHWMIQQVLSAEHKERFELLGHSFGARIVLKLLPQYADQLDSIHLAAADGLRPVWMYKLKWIPSNIHQSIQTWLNRPSRFLRFAKSLLQIGLLNPHSYKFAEHHLATPMRRRRLFGFWLSLCHFAIDHKTLIRQLNQMTFSIHLYMGKRDRIIPLQYAKVFSKKVPRTNLILLDKGHKVIGKELGLLILGNIGVGVKRTG